MNRLTATAVLPCLAALALPAGASAAIGADTFNAPGQTHAARCVTTAGPSAPLRFADASPTGFSVTDALSFTDGRCPAGSVRLDIHEVIPSAQGGLVFHRGGNGYADADNVKYGQLSAADLSPALPAPVPSSGGRGAACAPAPAEPPYAVQVHSIPDEMHYKRPQDVAGGSNRGASFMHYGDPGADQGDRRDIHYSYLLWSFVNVRGGGMVRSLLAPGQIVTACDVDPIAMSSWDRAGNVNGQVTARYVRVLAGNGCPLYGWMAWSHDFYGDSAGSVAHERAAAAPGPDPAADPACPVAAPATPPAAETGDALAAADGSWALTAGVDSQGAVTSYHFEIGPDPGYGGSTAPVDAGSVDATVPVSSSVGPLAPSTTYHYRVVASSVHGAALGEDRTFVTSPAAPQPPPPALPAILPPAPTPPVLSGLRVAPRSFRRARTRRAAPARIRFRVSSAAAVALTFERRTVGVRRAGTCRPAPRRGIQRHARRCARWVPVRGRTLRHQAGAAGSAALRFGGWVGTRRLARGSYRVRAVPRAGSDLTGRGRLARFTLR